MDKRIDVLATALKAGMTVHDLAELELAYAPPYGSDPVNLAGMAAENVTAGDVSVAQWNEVALLDAGTTLLLDLPKRGNNVRSAALGQFASKDFKCRSGFGQEVWRRFHKESTWMFIPCLCDPRIDGRRLFGGLDTEWILVVVTRPERWCAQMNDRVVAFDLLIKVGADGREKVAGPIPVCAPVNFASVAQDNRWLFGIGNTFELALNGSRQASWLASLPLKLIESILDTEVSTIPRFFFEQSCSDSTICPGPMKANIVVRRIGRPVFCSRLHLSLES